MYHVNAQRVINVNISILKISIWIILIDQYMDYYERSDYFEKSVDGLL